MRAKINVPDGTNVKTHITSNTNWLLITLIKLIDTHIFSRNHEQRFNNDTPLRARTCLSRIESIRNFSHKIIFSLALFELSIKETKSSLHKVISIIRLFRKFIETLTFFPKFSINWWDSNHLTFFLVNHCIPWKFRSSVFRKISKNTPPS